MEGCWVWNWQGGVEEQRGDLWVQWKRTWSELVWEKRMERVRLRHMIGCGHTWTSFLFKSAFNVAQQLFNKFFGYLGNTLSLRIVFLRLWVIYDVDIIRSTDWWSIMLRGCDFNAPDKCLIHQFAIVHNPKPQKLDLGKSHGSICRPKSTKHQNLHSHVHVFKIESSCFSFTVRTLRLNPDMTKCAAGPPDWHAGVGLY